MNALEHYRQAETLLRNAWQTGGPDGTALIRTDSQRDAMVARAQVHATLAVAASAWDDGDPLGEPPCEPCDRTDLPEVADMHCPCGFEAGEHPAWRRRYCSNRRFPEHGTRSPCAFCGYEAPK